MRVRENESKKSVRAVKSRRRVDPKITEEIYIRQHFVLWFLLISECLELETQLQRQSARVKSEEWVSSLLFFFFSALGSQRHHLLGLQSKERQSKKKSETNVGSHTLT